MSDAPVTAQRTPLPPPGRHQLALMIWVAVVPTLTLLNVVLGPQLEGSPVALRTVVVATAAVPIAEAPPGLLLTTTDCCHSSERRGANSRP